MMLRRFFLSALCLALFSFSSVAQTITPGAGPFQTMFVYTGAPVATTAVQSTEETLVTYVLPAGKLANVGDRLHIVASAAVAGNANSKLIRLRLGAGAGGIAASSTANSPSGVAATIVYDVVKTGASTQKTICSGNLLGVTLVQCAGSLVTAVTDTAAMTITLTGANNTAATAASITFDSFNVDYFAGPSS